LIGVFPLDIMVQSSISFLNRARRDGGLEHAFRLSRFTQDRNRLVVVYCLTIIFIGLNIINDIFFATNLDFGYVLVLRVIHMVVGVSMLHMAWFTDKPSTLDFTVLLWTFCTLVLTALIIATRPPDYFHSMMIDMVIVIMLYMYLPQPFKRQLFSGLIYTAVLLVVYEISKDITPAVRLQSYLTMSVVNILGVIFAYQSHTNSRELFLSLQKEQNLSSELQEAVNRLNRLNKERARIYSLIAHDLRSPLNAIKGFSSILMEERGGMEKETAEIVKHVSDGASSLNRLLEDLLLWTMWESDKIEAEFSSIQLKDYVKDVIKYSAEFARYKEVEVVLDVDADIYVEADPKMLESILRNLLNNALKYSFRAKVIIHAQQNKDLVTIGITDHGVGLSADKILKIKQNFHQSAESSAGTLGEKGSGLGLQMVNDFLVLHGSNLQIESEQGQGTTMSFTLKAVSAPERVQTKGNRVDQLKDIL
jgi:signal transduction histidine kinase